MWPFSSQEQSPKPVQTASQEHSRQTVEIMRYPHDQDKQRELGKKYGFSETEIAAIIRASVLTTLSPDRGENAHASDHMALAHHNEKLRALNPLHKQRGRTR